MKKKKMIKWQFWGFLPLLLLLPLEMPTSSDVQSDSSLEKQACSVYNHTFTAGEELTYKVYYNLNFVWIPAGEVVFSVRDVGTQYHISAVGKTYSSYEWFFKVRDTYEVYIDKQSLLPSLSIRDIQEGKFTLYDKITFDQNSNTTYSVRGSSKSEIKERNEYNVGNCMHDILSIIYYARNVNYNSLDIGDNFPIEIFMDKEVWPLKVSYGGREEAKRVKGQGKFNTILFSPETIPGQVFEEGTKINVWATDDANRLPLLIESPVSVGSIKAVLKDYKGLRHDLTAQEN